MPAPLLVADSGPLIALVRLNLLALPSRLFSQVLVSTTVWFEVTRAARPDELLGFTAALAAGQFNVIDDADVDAGSSTTELEVSRLDEGELSVLRLALTRHAAVLIDERHARAVAARLGLPLIGTLGLLLRARELGLVGPVRPLTDLLIASGYFLARPLVEKTLAALGE